MMTPSSSGTDTPNEPNRSVEEFLTEITRMAQSRNFSRANELREQLIQAAPMALKEIIHAAEIIEKEMTAARDSEHFAAWEKLYRSLSDEEKNGLFYSMKKYVIPAGKNILTHQSFNDRLFFIDKGEVAIYRTKGDKKNILAKLGKGELLGEYTFCSISLCSASAITTQETKLYCLERSTAESWEETQPALLNKLIDFCNKEGHMDQIAIMKKEEEIAYPRHPVEGPVTANLLSAGGERTKTHFRGTLGDISRSGVCFQFKCTKKSTARALLTRKLQLSYSIGKSKDQAVLTNTGRVVQVSFHLYSDYSLHVQFDQLLPVELMKKIIPGAK